MQHTTGPSSPVMTGGTQLALFEPDDAVTVNGYVFELVDWYRPGKEDRQRWLWLGQQQGHYVRHPKGPTPRNVSFLWHCDCGVLGDAEGDSDVEHIQQAGVVDDDRRWVVKVPATGRVPGVSYPSYIEIPSPQGPQRFAESDLIPSRLNPVDWS